MVLVMGDTDPAFFLASLQESVEVLKSRVARQAAQAQRKDAAQRAEVGRGLRWRGRGGGAGNRVLRRAGLPACLLSLPQGVRM